MSREKSPFMTVSVARSGREDDGRVARRRCVLVEAHTKIGGTLWLEEIVERSHLCFIVGTTHDLVCAVLGELAIRWRAVSQAVEARPNADPLVALHRADRRCQCVGGQRGTLGTDR